MSHTCAHTPPPPFSLPLRSSHTHTHTHAHTHTHTLSLSRPLSRPLSLSLSLPLSPLASRATARGGCGARVLRCDERRSHGRRLIGGVCGSIVQDHHAEVGEGVVEGGSGRREGVKGGSERGRDGVCVGLRW